MAARKNLSHMDKTREKIKSSLLINRLIEHILSDKPTMVNSQVTAALGLIKKTVPDLQSIELTGDESKPVQIKRVIEFIDATKPT